MTGADSDEADSDEVVPFRLEVGPERLQDLRDRLHRTRWPDRETAAGWAQGAPLEKVRALCDYWRDGYDWQRCETALDSWGQFRTRIGGLGVHFLHVRSPEPDALPMVLTHGWPGSVVEFAKVLGPLSDPVRHGGSPRDAFHLVVPSLPGYGFSDPPTRPGWGVDRIARTWATLMDRLGYRHWVAQGTDWGAVVTTALAAAAPPGLAAAHLSTVTLAPRDGARLGAADEAVLGRVRDRFGAQEFGYAQQQGTRPQTLAYGLVDSPAAQAAWIYEKLWAWSDHDGDLSSVLSDDDVLDDVMLYWLPGAGGSAARLYWESLADAAMTREVRLPMGVSASINDTTWAPRAWARQWFPDLVFWSQPERGGHFAAWEQPDRFVQDVRQCFRTVR